MEAAVPDIASGTGRRSAGGSRGGRRLARLAIPLGCVLLLALQPTREMAIQAMSDAYWQVASFVAATLWVFYALQARLDGSGRLARMLNPSGRFQVLFASFMGLLPGCGGAIIVMTQFVKGRLSFGALVAVLTSTMGDAAFLLLAARPADALIVFACCFVAGLMAGLAVDAVHETTFLRPDTNTDPLDHVHFLESNAQTEWSGLIWRWLIVPTAVVGLIVALQYDMDSLMSLPEGASALVGASLALVLLFAWAIHAVRPHTAVSECAHHQYSLIQRVAVDTNSVLSWVIVGFIAFELVVMATGFDVTELNSVASVVLIPAAIAVGWIPGCGPQILTTSLYISGGIPLSAQVGNAISNDGDALFPALAMAPKAALVATVYSTVPAIIMAYSYAALFE